MTKALTRALQFFGEVLGQALELIPKTKREERERERECVCVCVTLGIIGILSDLFGLPFCFLAFVKAGGPWTLGWHGPTKTHPSCRENVPAWCTWAVHYKTHLVATFFLFLFLCKVLMQLQSRTARRHLVVRSIDDFFWNGWPRELFGASAGWTSSSFLGVLTCTLRKWNPRPACGTAFSSVHPILSVFGLAPTRDEPAECLPWTR